VAIEWRKQSSMRPATSSRPLRARLALGTFHRRRRTSSDRRGLRPARPPGTLARTDRRGRPLGGTDDIGWSSRRHTPRSRRTPSGWCRCCPGEPESLGRPRWPRGRTLLVASTSSSSSTNRAPAAQCPTACRMDPTPCRPCRWLDKGPKVADLGFVRMTSARLFAFAYSVLPWGASAVGVACLLVACGDDGDGRPRSGAGGGAAQPSGGTSGSGGGEIVSTGGSPPPDMPPLTAPLTEYSACARYVESVCIRDYECGTRDGRPDQCLAQAFEGCPDLFFSPGATRTPEGLVDCAAVYAEFPCMELLAGRLPACVTPGTRQGGQACIYPSQCESLMCQLQPDGCGECIALVQPGETCSQIAVCPSGEQCRSGACSPSDPETPISNRSENERCYGDAQCAEGLSCLVDDDSLAKCLVPPGAGQPCAEGTGGRLVCNTISYCDQGGTCQARPTDGQPCAFNVTTDSVSICAPDHSCRSEICIAHKQHGETCGGPSERLYLADCNHGLVCACTDESCSEGVCAELAGASTGCAPPLVVCPAGATCENGWCTKEPLNAFAEACGE
jgi:hypothetical protein